MLPRAEGNKRPRRELDLEIDRLDTKISELRVLYEQYFIQLLPLPPDKEHRELKRLIRTLLKAPFKNSQTRFRLRQVVQRYHTYNTYWERVFKQRDEGKYSRDVFKADVRDRERSETSQANSGKSKVEKQMQHLFSAYENALKKNGQSASNLDYNAFKKALVVRAKALKEQHGLKKLKYRVVVKNGKVSIKASEK